jgi:hypothetical protein
MPDDPSRSRNEVESFLTSIRKPTETTSGEQAFNDLRSKLYPESVPDEEEVQKAFEKLKAEVQSQLPTDESVELTPDDLRRMDIAERNARRQQQADKKLSGVRRTRAREFYLAIYHRTLLGGFKESMDKQAAFAELMTVISNHKVGAYDHFKLTGDATIFQITDETIDQAISVFCKKFSLSDVIVAQEMARIVSDRQDENQQAIIKNRSKKASSRRLERELKPDTGLSLPKDPFIVVDGKKVMR